MQVREGGDVYLVRSSPDILVVDLTMKYRQGYCEGVVGLFNAEDVPSLTKLKNLS